jgi:hypothetical protein
MSRSVLAKAGTKVNASWNNGLAVIYSYTVSIATGTAVSVTRWLTRLGRGSAFARNLFRSGGSRPGSGSGSRPGYTGRSTR